MTIANYHMPFNKITLHLGAVQPFHADLSHHLMIIDQSISCDVVLSNGMQ
jgi:hypothetical protein